MPRRRALRALRGPAPLKLVDEENIFVPTAALRALRGPAPLKLRWEDFLDKLADSPGPPWPGPIEARGRRSCRRLRYPTLRALRGPAPLKRLQQRIAHCRSEISPGPPWPGPIEALLVLLCGVFWSFSPGPPWPGPIEAARRRSGCSAACGSSPGPPWPGPIEARKGLVAPKKLLSDSPGPPWPGPIEASWRCSSSGRQPRSPGPPWPGPIEADQRRAGSSPSSTLRALRGPAPLKLFDFLIHLQLLEGSPGPPWPGPIEAPEPGPNQLPLLDLSGPSVARPH